MKTPIVSVCIITYNHELYIREAIEGVLMQKTTFPIELIISEDCGPDSTRKIVKEYAAKYPDIIIADLPEKNRGMIDNFHHCVSLAKGKYIALCEGDDYWTDPLKLQKQVDFLEANLEYGLVYTDLNSYNENTKQFVNGLFKNHIWEKNNSFEKHLTSSGSLAPCTWMIRSKYIFDTLFDLKKDNPTDGSFVLALEIMLKTNITMLDDVTAVYRINDGSASRLQDKKKWYLYHKGVFETQKKYLKYIQNQELKALFLLRKYNSYIYISLKYRDIQLLKESLIYVSNYKYGYSKHAIVRLFFYTKIIIANMISLICKKILK